MELNGLSPDKGKIVVNGATGGVASVSIDLLAQRGYHVVAVTSKPGEADYVRALGAREVMASSDMPSGTRPLETALWQGAVDSLGGAPLVAAGPLHPIAHKPLATLTASDIRATYETAARRSLRRAEYAMQILRAVLRWNGVVIPGNPLGRETAGRDRITITTGKGDPAPIPPELLGCGGVPHRERRRSSHRTTTASSC